MLVIRISQLAGAVMPSSVMRPSGVVMPSGSDLQSRQLLPRLHRLIVNVPERNPSGASDTDERRIYCDC